MRYPHGEWNDRSRARLEALVERLDDAALARRVGEGGWTVAAVLVHVAFWDRHELAWLEDLGRADPRNRADLDAWLAAQEARPQKPWQQVNDEEATVWHAARPRDAIREVLAAAEVVDGAIASLPPEVVDLLYAAGRGWMLERHDHREEHAEEIERVLQAAP